MVTIDRTDPYHRLLAGILLQAAADLQPSTRRDTSYSNIMKGRYRDADREDARDFVRSNSDEPFSFNWICQHLELSPDVLRKQMLSVTVPFVINPCIWGQDPYDRR